MIMVVALYVGSAGVPALSTDKRKKETGWNIPHDDYL